MIHLEGVAKRYGSVQAVQPLSLLVPAGQTTVLIGPSGCGKSTLLRLMAGLVRPDAGRVLFDGAPLQPAALRRVRHRIGYVIQEGGLFPHLTAHANVALVARHLGWGADRVEARMASLADLVRLPAGRLGSYPRALSGGQRQRVGLMRALMLDPAVLLLDEPLGALDPMIRADLQDDLLGIIRTLGKTTVMVTHDLAEAALFADELVLLQEGRIVQRGTPQDLLERPAEPFAEAFVQAQRFLKSEGVGG